MDLKYKGLFWGTHCIESHVGDEYANLWDTKYFRFGHCFPFVYALLCLLFLCFMGVRFPSKHFTLIFDFATGQT